MFLAGEGLKIDQANSRQSRFGVVPAVKDRVRLQLPAL